jgi:hypothetical protein
LGQGVNVKVTILANLANFSHFRQKIAIFSKVNVMINFLHKPIVVGVTNANFLQKRAKIFLKA